VSLERLAAGLPLEAERVEGSPGEFEISCQVCDGESMTPFPRQPGTAVLPMCSTTTLGAR
jgi:hypothetical protein